MADDFLFKARLSVPADTSVSRDIGFKIAKNDMKSSLHQCPFCYTLIVPSVSSLSTISKKKLKKSKCYYPIVKLSQLSSKKHFMKIHCKVCKKSHLVPFSKPISSDKKSASIKHTPQKRRRSCDLKSLFKQTTPKTPPTPSLLDFLFQ